MNLDGVGTTRIDHNVILMTAPQPGITLNAALLGPLTGTGNRVWRADGGTLFEVHTPGPRTWEGNDPLAVTPPALAQLQLAVEALRAEGQAVSAGGSTARIPAAAAAVRTALATFRP